MAHSWHHFLSASARLEAAGLACKDQPGTAHHSPASGTTGAVRARVGKHLALFEGIYIDMCTFVSRHDVTDAAVCSKKFRACLDLGSHVMHEKMLHHVVTVHGSAAFCTHVTLWVICLHHIILS